MQKQFVTQLTAFHECHAPVDASSETFAQKSFSDIAFRVENGADEIGVVHRLEDYLNVALQQARFYKKAGFFGVGDDHWWIGLAIGVETKAWTADATYHQRNILEARQEECSNGGAIADMLNDSTHWLASLKIDKMAGVLDLPHNVALSGRLGAEASFALSFSLILQLHQSLQFRRATNVLAAHLQQTLAHGQLGDVLEVVRVLAQEDNAIIAGSVWFSLGLEEDFLTNKQATQEFSRFPSPRLIFRGIVSGTVKRENYDRK